MVSLWVVRPPSTSSKYTYFSKWKITHHKTIVITAQRNMQPINKKGKEAVNSFRRIIQQMKSLRSTEKRSTRFAFTGKAIFFINMPPRRKRNSTLVRYIDDIALKRRKSNRNIITACGQAKFWFKNNHFSGIHQTIL